MREYVGTQEAMIEALRSTRPGGSIGYVEVPHGVALDGEKRFFSHVRLHGGPAPVRRLPFDAPARRAEVPYLRKELLRLRAVSKAQAKAEHHSCGPTIAEVLT